MNAVLHFLQGELGNALAYFAIVVFADVVLGITLAFKGKEFDLRKVGDFVFTTVGMERTLVFLGSLVVMYLHRDVFTASAVAGLALVNATSVLPDLYGKVSALFFAGKLKLPFTK